METLSTQQGSRSFIRSYPKINDHEKAYYISTFCRDDIDVELQ